MSLLQAAVIVFIIWLAAIITAIPSAVFLRVEIHEGSGLPRCAEVIQICNSNMAKTKMKLTTLLLYRRESSQ